MSTGTLYIVATPIGNLEDITFRALRILNEVSLIAAEDTRRTRILLNHYKIMKPLISYHEHNHARKEKDLLKMLSSGKSIALVSDAGTPGISDPGIHLVRAAIEASIPIVPIPGPTALVSALSISGLPTGGFLFEGFLPSRQGERRSFLQGLTRETRTMVFYESPRRIKDTVREIISVLGDRKMALCREITKLNEEIIRGRASEILGMIQGRNIKGEITLVIQGAMEENIGDGTSVDEAIGELRREGKRTRDIARAISGMFGIKSQDAYMKVLEKLKRKNR